MAKWNFIAILFLALANFLSPTIAVKKDTNLNSLSPTIAVKKDTNLNSLSPTMAVKKDTNLMLWGCSASTDRELCLSLLRSDPRSYDAKGYTELGKIIVEFALAKAEETLSFVKSLENKTTDKAVGTSLAVCRSLYDLIIHERIPSALETSTESEEDATRIMGEAVLDDENCEKEFSKNHVKSVLTKRNNDFSDIVYIAQSLWFLVWG